MYQVTTPPSLPATTTWAELKDVLKCVRAEIGSDDTWKINGKKLSDKVEEYSQET